MYGAPAIVGAGAAYKGMHAYLIVIHAIHDDGSRLTASLDRSVDLGETLVVTLDGVEVARAYGADTLSLMKRYNLTHEFPAYVRKGIVVDWATYCGVDPRSVAWWR